MPYADSDFFVSLFKGEDWLKKRAFVILDKYKTSIWTSKWTVIEILLIGERYEFDPNVIVESIFKISDVKDADKNFFIAIAHLMKENGMTVFDALHALSCDDDYIISSDKIFDKIGMNRIKLEE